MLFSAVRRINLLKCILMTAVSTYTVSVLNARKKRAVIRAVCLLAAVRYPDFMKVSVNVHMISFEYTYCTLICLHENDMIVFMCLVWYWTKLLEYKTSLNFIRFRIINFENPNNAAVIQHGFPFNLKQLHMKNPHHSKTGKKDMMSHKI